MKDIWLWIGIGLLGLLLVAAITPTPVERATWQTKLLPCDKDTAFQASLEYLQDLGYTILNTIPETGFISTAYSSQAQLQGSWGTIENLLIGEHRFAVTIMIRTVAANACNVRVNLIAEEWVSGSLWSAGHWRQDEIYYDEHDYQKFFDGLLKRV